MRNFKDTFKTRKRSFISAFSVCMTAPLNYFIYSLSLDQMRVAKEELFTEKILGREFQVLLFTRFC